MNLPSYTQSGLYVAFRGFMHKLLMERVIKRIHAKRRVRRLEIGPGDYRVDGHETLNIQWSDDTDYIAPADRIPFADKTFDSVYASHVLEHFVWYKTIEVLREWHRVLKDGGTITIMVPDALKIAKAFVNDEENGTDERGADGWYRFNTTKDPCLWFSGRIFSYGDGSAGLNHPNWHKAAFSKRHLATCLIEAGFHNIQYDPKPLGADHGWINLGITATKGKL